MKGAGLGCQKLSIFDSPGLALLLGESREAFRRYILVVEDEKIIEKKVKEEVTSPIQFKVLLKQHRKAPPRFLLTNEKLLEGFRGCFLFDPLAYHN